MTFGGINYLAIPAAAVAAWLVGAVWYMVLSRPWMAAHGWTSREDMPRKTGAAFAAPFVLSFIAELVMAWALAGVIGHLGPGQATVTNGVISGFFIWLGFVLTTIAVNNAYPGRRLLLTAIDAGHWLAVLLVMGVVIGLFGA